DGGSPLTSDRDGARSRALYFEALDANLTRGWAPLTGVRVDGWKYIDLPIPELYDLARDAHEERNLVERDPTRLRTLQARLKEIGVGRSAVPGAVPAVVDAETSHRLASLGYIGSVEPTDKRVFSVHDDPKNLIGLNEA